MIGILAPTKSNVTGPLKYVEKERDLIGENKGGKMESRVASNYNEVDR